MNIGQRDHRLKSGPTDVFREHLWSPPRPQAASSPNPRPEVELVPVVSRRQRLLAHIKQRSTALLTGEA